MSLGYYKHFLFGIFLFGWISESVEKDPLSKFSHQPDNRTFLDLLYELDNSSHDIARLDLPTAMGTGDQPKAFRLDNSNRSLAVRDTAVSKVLRLLHEYSKDFGILFTLLQDRNSHGTLLALSSNDSSYLEIESDGRKKEIRLHYSRKGEARVSVFPYDIADGKWHKVALKVTGKIVSLFVDCNRIYKRKILGIEKPSVSESLRLFLGQRNQEECFLTGALHEVKIVTHVKRYVLLCSSHYLDHLTYVDVKFIRHIVRKKRRLQKQLRDMHTQLRDLEQHKCERHCYDNFTIRMADEKWARDDCTTCRCENGTVECQTQKCPQFMRCKHPIYKEGECCPQYCESTTCLFQGEYYNQGAVIYPLTCVTCTCDRGHVECDQKIPERDCPKINCTERDYIHIFGKCCPICKNTDFCGQGHNCHAFATCVNLVTKMVCTCNAGFQGDGINCTDIDECLTIGGPVGNHCWENDVCVNTPGSYRCDCRQGYIRADKYSSCEDIDECRHSPCDRKEVCVNTPGSYRCACKAGDSRTGENKTCATQPLICEKRIYGDTRPYRGIPWCRFPLKLRPVVERFLNNSPSLSPECAVRVECDFEAYFKRHRKTIPRFCYFMDWIFDKTFRWLGHEASTTMTTSMAIFIKGIPTQSGMQIRWVSSLDGMMSFFDRYTSLFGYRGHAFEVFAAFNNCLAETNGRAAIPVQGDDPCNKTEFWNPIIEPTIDGCRSDPVDDFTKASCVFERSDTISKRCNKIHWMFYACVFSGGSRMRLTLHLIMDATDMKGENYSRVLSPVKRAVVTSYIKNFLSEISIKNLSVLRIKIQRVEAW